MGDKEQKERLLMKYFPDDLRKEYEYYATNNPDIEGLDHPLINLSDTFRAYFILVHYFNDTSSGEERERMCIGIRSIDLLASALGRQNVTFGGKQKYKEPLDICATLFYGMVKNHSFTDGNKRTGLLILLYQLQLYGYFPRASKKEFEKLVISVAESSLDKKYRKQYKKVKRETDWEVKVISRVIKQLVVKKDNTYHVAPTMREFCAALAERNVSYVLENGKIKFSYKEQGKWIFVKPVEHKYSIPFGGWTRTVGARTARDTLKALGLYEQFASYQDLLEGGEPLYELVDNFREPLRRLKDR